MQTLAIHPRLSQVVCWGCQELWLLGRRLQATLPVTLPLLSCSDPAPTLMWQEPSVPVSGRPQTRLQTEPMLSTDTVTTLFLEQNRHPSCTPRPPPSRLLLALSSPGAQDALSRVHCCPQPPATCSLSGGPALQVDPASPSCSLPLGLAPSSQTLSWSAVAPPPPHKAFPRGGAL